ILRGNADWRGWLWTAISIWGIVLVLPELILCALLAGSYFIESEVLKLSGSVEDWLMTSLLCLVLVLGGIVFSWLSSSFFFAIQVRSLEGMTVGKALRRSWALSKGGRLKTLIIRISLVAVAQLLYFVFAVTLILILRTTIQSAWIPYYRSISYFVRFSTVFAVSTLIGPIFPIALTLVYYDQRIRLEGYDIERMMDDAGLNTPSIPRSGEAPSVAAAAAVEGRA
ncbi:MAG: glycerophosphoryl diester phosphodiesterase membrane domain-containing protein, partial [Terracidiphilus sp.]